MTNLWFFISDLDFSIIFTCKAFVKFFILKFDSINKKTSILPLIKSISSYILFLESPLKHKITLIGSSGLIGSHFLEGINSDDYKSVKAITRKRISNLEKKNFIKQALYDFSDLEKMRKDLNTDVLVSSLGTTIKNAGSKENFFKIDHDLPLAISKIAKEEGCKSMILVSSVGAKISSKFFYSSVKGLLEESIENIGFEAFHIIRPSLLLGKRTEKRPAEYISKLVIAPLSFLIPWYYRPIHAKIIANTIKHISKSNIYGKHIWEGRKLFEIKKSF